MELNYILCLSNLTEREVRQEKNLQVLRPGKHSHHKKADKKRNQRIFDLSNTLITKSLKRRETRGSSTCRFISLKRPGKGGLQRILRAFRTLSSKRSGSKGTKRIEKRADPQIIHITAFYTHPGRRGRTGCRSLCRQRTGYRLQRSDRAPRRDRSTWAERAASTGEIRS